MKTLLLILLTLNLVACVEPSAEQLKALPTLVSESPTEDAEQPSEPVVEEPAPITYNTFVEFNINGTMNAQIRIEKFISEGVYDSANAEVRNVVISQANNSFYFNVEAHSRMIIIKGMDGVGAVFNVHYLSQSINNLVLPTSGYSSIIGF